MIQNSSKNRRLVQKMALKNSSTDQTMMKVCIDVGSMYRLVPLLSHFCPCTDGGDEEGEDEDGDEGRPCAFVAHNVGVILTDVLSVKRRR